MPSSKNGFGLRPYRHPSAARIVAEAFPGGIANQYASSIYKGSEVKLANGKLQVCAAGEAGIGVFAGVEYTDAQSKVRVYSKHWPANTDAEEIVAYVYTDPEIVYEIQADGTLTSDAAIGDMADFTAAADDTGSDLTGISSATLSATLAGAGNSAQFVIVGLSGHPDNDWADAFPIVLVRINEMQLRTSVNAI